MWRLRRPTPSVRSGNKPNGSSSSRRPTDAALPVGQRRYCHRRSKRYGGGGPRRPLRRWREHCQLAGGSAGATGAVLADLAGHSGRSTTFSRSSPIAPMARPERPGSGQRCCRHGRQLPVVSGGSLPPFSFAPPSSGGGLVTPKPTKKPRPSKTPPTPRRPPRRHRRPRPPHPTMDTTGNARPVTATTSRTRSRSAQTTRPCPPVDTGGR